MTKLSAEAESKRLLSAPRTDRGSSLDRRNGYLAGFREGYLFSKQEEGDESLLRKYLARIAELEKALEITLTYGLPPHDVSGQKAWGSARKALNLDKKGGGEKEGEE